MLACTLSFGSRALQAGTSCAALCGTRCLQPFRSSDVAARKSIKKYLEQMSEGVRNLLRKGSSRPEMAAEALREPWDFVRVVVEPC